MEARPPRRQSLVWFLEICASQGTVWRPGQRQRQPDGQGDGLPCLHSGEQADQQREGHMAERCGTCQVVERRPRCEVRECYAKAAEHCQEVGRQDPPLQDGGGHQRRPAERVPGPASGIVCGAAAKVPDGQEEGGSGVRGRPCPEARPCCADPDIGLEQGGAPTSAEHACHSDFGGYQCVARVDGSRPEVQGSAKRTRRSNKPCRLHTILRLSFK